MALSYFWYGTKPTISFTPTTVTQSEGFEAWPNVNPFFTVTNPSTMPGTEAGWQASTVFVHSGEVVIANEDITDVPGSNQQARIDVSFTIPAYAKNIKIDYFYLQDCEVNFDGLKVYLDGSLIHDYISNGVYNAWTQGTITTAVTGARTLTFEYHKDGKTTIGTDSVYIDDLSVSYTYDTITETPGVELVRFDGSTGYRMMYHLLNLQSPPISFIEQRIPFRPGSIHQHTDIRPRDIEIGVMVEGNTPSDLRTKVRNLVNKLVNVDGVLYAQYSDGTQRRLYCRYSGGLEGEETADTKGSGFYQKVLLTFRAFDPFWYKTLVVSSHITNDIINNVTNNGAWEAYPIIYVDGMSSAIDISIWVTSTAEPEEGSNKRLKINYTIPSGKKLIVDMKKRTVKLDDGTNLYSYIDSVANAFQTIPNNGIKHEIDVDISGTEANGRYHVYLLEPHWGV
jgi:phage-related protein